MSEAEPKVTSQLDKEQERDQKTNQGLLQFCNLQTQPSNRRMEFRQELIIAKTKI